MPKCIKCGKPVVSGYVLDAACLDKIRDTVRGQQYTCYTCGNTEHPADARFCKICGTAITPKQQGDL